MRDSFNAFENIATIGEKRSQLKSFNSHFYVKPLFCFEITSQSPKTRYAIPSRYGIPGRITIDWIDLQWEQWRLNNIGLLIMSILKKKCEEIIEGF